MSSTRSRILIATCALIVPVAIACEPAADDADTGVFPAEEPAPAAMAPPAELESATDRYVAAWNGDDPAAVAPFFTEDATAMVDGETYQGRTGIEEGWLPNVPLISDLEVTETTTEPMDGDWYSEGTYTATVSEPDTEPMAVTGRYTVVWTLDADGQWRIRSTEVVGDEPVEG
jgi:uncharacterized protein (TIGR02246 family)